MKNLDATNPFVSYEWDSGTTRLTYVFATIICPTPRPKRWDSVWDTYLGYSALRTGSQAAPGVQQLVQVLFPNAVRCLKVPDLPVDILHFA